MASDTFNTGQTNVNNATGSGSSAIGAFDPNAWQSSTQGGLNSITSSQAAGNQGLVDAFKTQISSQPSATDYYNQGRNLFNVQGLQDTSNNLNSAMLNTPNSNLASAKGFNFDENQVQQKNSQDLQRLAPAATAAQGYANTAQGNAISFANNGIQQNQMNLIPLTAAQQMQSDLYARQQSGFTQTSQATLASLQAKMTQGVSLSNQEMASYSQLTAAEASYQGSLATANATVKSAQTTAQNQILPSSNGTSTYYNPVTGQAYNPFATPAKPT